jgi:hypothetical protein
VFYAGLIGCDQCQTPDEFCKGVAERLGIEYIPKEKYAFTQDEVDTIFKVCDDITSPLSPKEEVKYKHLKEYLSEHTDFIMLDLDYDGLIRAVLKDLPQEFVVGKSLNDSPLFYQDRMDGLLPDDLGIIYQRIGSISEKVEIVKEGWV